MPEEAQVPQIVYVGPLDQVDVPLYQIRVTAGEPVDVSAEQAADLLRQIGNWAPVTPAPTKTKES